MPPLAAECTLLAGDRVIRGAASSTLVRGFALSLAALTAASFVSVGFSANAPLIEESLHLSHAGVGAIASAIYGCAALTSGIGGRFTDRIGPAPVLGVAMVALGLGVLVAVSAPLAPVFFLGVLVCGLGYGAVNPPTNVLANPRTARRRGLAMSGKQSGIPLGGILAGLALPPLAATIGWRWSMVLPVVVCVLLGLAAVALRDREQYGQSSSASTEPDGGIALRLPRAYVFGFLMAGVQVSIFTFLTIYLTEVRSFTVSGAGSMLALLMLGGLLGRPAWGWMSDRRHWDRTRVLQAVTLGSGAGLLLLPLLGASALALLMPLVGFCSVGWNGVYVTTVAESVAPTMVGSVTGLALVLINVGAVVLPPAFGWLVASSSWTAGWLVCAVLSLLAAAAMQASRVGRARDVSVGDGVAM